MRHKAVVKLIEEIKAADAADDGNKVENLVKELVFGAAQNLARIADALEKPKP